MDTAVGGKPQRTPYLDVARATAIISITLNHAVNRSYKNYSGQRTEFLSLPVWENLFKTLITVFSHIGVPLFLMITGALILNKKMDNGSDIKKFYRHNLFRTLITAEIWYVIMYWYLVLFKPDNLILEHFGWKGAVDRMFQTMLFQNQVTFDCMWYMPMILCVYITLPFLIIVKDHLTGRSEGCTALPLGVLYLVSMVLPFFNTLFALQGESTYRSAIEQTYLFSYFYIYILIGYWIGKGRLDAIRTRWVVLGTAASFLLCCGFQYWAYSRPVNYVVSYDFPLLPICAGGLFALIRRWCGCVKRLPVFITRLAQIAFAVYFLHILIMTALVVYLDQYAPDMERAVRLVLLEVLSVGLSIAIIQPLSRFKLFRKYFFLIK